MAPHGSVLVCSNSNHDDTDNARRVSRVAGFAVTPAATGADAVSMAQHLRPEVVLMDLAMPGVIDGWEATRRIKRDLGLSNNTVVIAVTGHAFPTERDRAMHAGCQAIFTKPYNVAAVAAKVARALRARSNTISRPAC